MPKVKEWSDMTGDEKAAFIKESMEDADRRQYEAARRLYGDKGAPPWAELTDEAKERVRAERIQYRREMAELGRRIANGEVDIGLEIEAANVR